MGDLLERDDVRRAIRTRHPEDLASATRAALARRGVLKRTSWGEWCLTERGKQMREQMLREGVEVLERLRSALEAHGAAVSACSMRHPSWGRGDLSINVTPEVAVRLAEVLEGSKR